MSKAKRKSATPAVPKEPEEQPLESVTVTLTDCDGIKLILKSPEAAATAAACKHLYDHAEKGAKEKMFLFTNDIHMELIKHSLQHEDQATRYYAIMCLGSMAQQNEILQKLAREETFLPLLVPMCRTSEGFACQQSASFVVSKIAGIHQYFAGVLWKHEAVPVIVPLLTSQDADIKKNAIIALSALASDAEARNSMLEESSVVPTVVDFLKSEYRDLQSNSLIALGNLCGTAEFREQMRQNNVFDKLLAIFREQKFEDLHTLVLDTMARMMRDRESFEMMFDNGDTQKVLDVLKDAVTKSNKEVLEVALTFLSALIHQDPTFSSKLYDMNIVPICQGLLIHESEVVVAKTCSLVGALAKHSLLCSEKFASHDDFFQHILSHMECETTVMREAATYALVFIMKSKSNCKNFMSNTGNGIGAEVLRRSAQESCLLAQKNALNAVLQILTHHEPDWDAVLLEKGYVEAMLTILESGDRLSMSRISGKPPPAIEDVTPGNPYKQRLDVLPLDADPVIRRMLEVRARSMSFVPRELMIVAAACLGHFMTYAEGRQKLLENAKFAETLTKNLAQCHGEARRQERFVMCQAIRHACQDWDVARMFTEAGGLVELHNVLASLPEFARECSLATSCITAILNHNPTMLYWLMGTLRCSHVTQNGFYTMAHYKPVSASVKQVLPSLEELSKGGVSNAFTAYYTNAVQSEPVNSATPQPAEPAPEPVKDRTGSKMAKPIKKKKLEKELTAKEDLIAAEAKSQEPALVPVWTPAPDHDLWLMIDEVTETIMRSSLLPSANLKVRQLAVYVSTRMGGAFTELDVRQGKILHLEHIAELKATQKSNAIPLGMIRCGTFMHRALLFKALADRLFLPCTLHRGAGYTAWNTFQCIDVQHREQLVDLMYKPGALLDLDTPVAQRYMRFH